MSAALEFLAELYHQVRRDYIDPRGGRYVCELLALSLAEKLIEDRKSPYVKRWRDIRDVNGTEQLLLFAPLRFEGRVRFDVHLACVCDGEVYDPLIDKPVREQEYTQRAFGKDLTSDIAHSQEELQRMWSD